MMQQQSKISELNMPKVEYEPAFIVGRHRYAHFFGKKAQILGIYMASPKGHAKNPCFLVEFEDKSKEFIALSDVLTGQYEIIGKEE